MAPSEPAAPGPPPETAPPVAIHLGPPPLVVQPVVFSQASTPLGERLALDLYAALTRAPAHPLSHGAGVPVRGPVSAQEVELTSAARTVLVPVIAPGLATEPLAPIAQQIHRWRAQHGGALQLCIARLDGRPATADLEQHLGASLSIVELYTDQPVQPEAIQRIVAKVALALRADATAPTLSIAYADGDSTSAAQAALEIHQALARQTVTAPVFNLLPLADAALDAHGAPDGHHLQILVVGDGFERDEACLERLLAAKAKGHPLLAVLVAEEKVMRVASLIGNVPSLRWDGNPDEIARSAALQWIKARVFRYEAERALRALSAPKPRFLNRPPELSDFVIGDRPRSKLVMYPDPQLSRAERRVLSHAHRRLHLLTPTTAYGFLRHEEEKLSTAPLQTPLDGMKVGMSVSSDAMAERSLVSVTQCHLQDVVVRVVRALLAAGGRIGYGGIFRKGNFTDLLSALVNAYARSGMREARLLSFLAACESRPETDWEPHPEIRHLADPGVGNAVVPPPAEDDETPIGLYYSDMRRVMCDALDASVVVGGAAAPRGANPASGYRGRYPGVVEEAWRMLRAEKPVYILGGFGGAAGAVAALLLNEKEIPDSLRDEAWQHLPGYDAHTRGHDEHEYRARIGLPESFGELVSDLRRLGRQLVRDDGNGGAGNGLSIADNVALLTSRDPQTIASLVLRGLCTVAAERSTQPDAPLRIELVHGSVLDSTALTAISVPVAHGVPIAGAAADVDALMGERLTRSASGDETLLTVGVEALPADFVHLARLTPLAHSQPEDAGGALPVDIRPAVGDACAHAGRLGFSRLGVVLYGASLIGRSQEQQFRALIDTMVGEFTTRLPRFTTLVWHEIDEARFERIRDYLAENPGVSLTTVRARGMAQVRHHQAVECLALSVDLSDDDTRLQLTISPPDGTAVVARHSKEIRPTDIDALAAGVDEHQRCTPPTETSLQRGEALRKLLFDDKLLPVLETLGSREVRITHNARASRIPFECLAYEQRPITTVTRRLTTSVTNPKAVFRRRPVGTVLNVLVVADPGQNLEGATQEGRQVQGLLQALPHVRSTLLLGEQATFDAVTEKIADADILHYCGHGFFDGPGDDASGIQLADEWLRPRDLQGLARLPSVAVINACESANVRAWQHANGVSFAEHWLIHGLESYLSTTWYLEEAGAVAFAKTLYSSLTRNKNLRQAVHLGREKLFDQGSREWCNYVLYGSGDFRLLDRL
jgi:hypothetical protein